MRFFQGFAKHKIALIVCGAILCFLVALFGLSVTGIFKLPFLENAVNAVVTPVHSFVTDAYNSVRSDMEKRSTISELNEEIAAITQRNKQLEVTVSQMNELQKENDRLRGLLGVTQTTPDVTYIAAAVSAKESGGWFVTFTLDKGDKDGVKKNDPVLSDSGLIGRVMELSDHACTVISIIDSRSAVAGMVERTRDNGICHGSLYVNDNDELMRMNYLPTGSELNTGDRIITSGLDGIYPKGLLIGTVRSISRETNEEDDRYVVLATAADFGHIEDVLIMSMQEGN